MDIHFNYIIFLSLLISIVAIVIVNIMRKKAMIVKKNLEIGKINEIRSSFPESHNLIMERPNIYSKPLEGVRTENYHPSDIGDTNQYTKDLNKYKYIDYLEVKINIYKKKKIIPPFKLKGDDDYK